jgi:uncharacterized membrane protein YkgB
VAVSGLWYSRRQLVLGPFEWIFGALLFAGFWDQRLGLLGAAGSAATFIATVTIIPFMSDGWDASAGGFPAMTGNVPFLMKDVVLLAASLYLLRQDALRVRSNDSYARRTLANESKRNRVDNSYGIAN